MLFIQFIVFMCYIYSITDYLDLSRGFLNFYEKNQLVEIPFLGRFSASRINSVN